MVTPALGAHFADRLPELSVAWQSEESPEPRIVMLNDGLATQLGLDPDWLRTDDGLRFLLGQGDGVERSVAQAYAGHQFGGFVPRLGDGRAVLVGDIEDRDGRLREIHLKGSGRTPFARGGDGRAVLGPMLREYVISEAMHALGVPSTRSLAVIATGRAVQRETIEPGAVLVRVASSHLRVGSFEYVRAAGDQELLRRLVDHAVERHYPDLAVSENPAAGLYERVVAAQADLIAQWMNIGFVHGVMNTDNMAISGETIDYGPCAFMDHFDPQAVFSSIDAQGRYAYGNQPAVGAWNLARFGETLLPLLADDADGAIEKAQVVLEGFGERYTEARASALRTKLGLTGAGDGEAADALAHDLLELMAEDHPDFTSLFRALASLTEDDREPALELVVDREAMNDWLSRWLALAPDRVAIARTNPVYIPRNHRVEEALNAAHGGDLGPFERLVEVVTRPFTEQEGAEAYAVPAPESFGAYTTYCGT